VGFMVLVLVSILVIVLDEKRKLAKRPFPTLKRLDGLNSVTNIEERYYSRWYSLIFSVNESTNPYRGTKTSCTTKWSSRLKSLVHPSDEESRLS
jgi:hypothetical protein